MTEPVYLDNAATAFPKAPGVAEAVGRFLAENAGNPGRGGHRLSVTAARAVEAAREEVAALLGGDPERTLLGPGATFWINTVIASVLGGGGRVVVSGLEHNAVMRPLRELESRGLVEVAVVEAAHRWGVPSAAEVAAVVAAAPTRLVVLNHVSNVSGAVLPVAAIAAAVAPVPVLVDGAQAAGHLPLDFAAMGVAAFACSGHKGLLGPPGIGVLLLAPGFHVAPLVRGGTGSASEHETMPVDLPDRLEAGTPNTVGAVGLGASCRWLRELGVEEIHRRELRLAERAAAGLAALPGVSLVGFDGHAQRIGIVSFSVAGRDGGELAACLDREHGIMLRAGLHCAPAAHRRLGSFPGGTLRVGVGPFTAEADIDRLLRAVVECGAAGS